MEGGGGGRKGDGSARCPGTTFRALALAGAEVQPWLPLVPKQETPWPLAISFSSPASHQLAPDHRTRFLRVENETKVGKPVSPNSPFI